MERWLKASVAEVAPIDGQKATDRTAAIKLEMAKAWDTTATREDMLKHVEEWLAYGAAPAEVKGCVLREELHPIMLEVYQERHPEDFAVAEVKPVGEVGLGEVEEIVK